MKVMNYTDLLIKFYNLHSKYLNSKITLAEVITTENHYHYELEYVKLNLNNELLDNFDKLLYALNTIRNVYGKPMIVSSGFRNPDHNKKVGGSKNSLHCKGCSCDIYDPNSELDEWLTNNVNFLKENKIYVEHPYYTKKWAHIQFVAPKSGKTFFIPYSGRPREKDRDDKFKNFV